jgi:hypothetical protein
MILLLSLFLQLFDTLLTRSLSDAVTAGDTGAAIRVKSPKLETCHDGDMIQSRALDIVP